MARFRFGPVLSYQAKYQDAIDALHRVPRSVIPGLWTYQMAWALQSLGLFEESQREVDTFLAGKVPDQGGVIHSVRAMLHAKHGDRKGAQADIDEAIRIARRPCPGASPRAATTRPRRRPRRRRRTTPR